MIKSWEDFDGRRAESLKFAKQTSEFNYINALSYFELMRKYFQKNGFPEPHKEVYLSGARKGQPKPFTEKESKAQIEDIQVFIHEEKNKKFRAVRGSGKNRKK